MTPSERAIIALRNARDTFQRYGDQHAAKEPPQPHKAQVNYAMVAEINDALLALTGEELVRSSDILELTSDMETPVQPPVPTHPAKDRLKTYLETLGDRDDDAFVHYYALVGDLRALTQL